MSATKRYAFSAIVVLAVVMFNLLGTSLFLHDHNIEGRHISHSHPYSGDPISHSHSGGTLLLIESLTNPDALVTTSSALVADVLDIFVYLNSNIVETDKDNIHQLHGLRAPPVL